MKDYNQHVVSFLEKMTSNDSLAHAFLFVGPQELTKTETANKLTKWIQGNHDKSFTEFIFDTCACDICYSIDEGLHADVHKTTGDMEVERAREIVRLASLSSFVGPHTVYIIERADKLRRESANTLLKCLEEPANTIFFLIAPTESSVLPTIASRCLVVRFVRTGLEAAWLPTDPALEHGEKFRNGGIKERIEIAEQMHKLSKEECSRMLEIWSDLYMRNDDAKAARVIQNVRRSINSNANIQTALTYVALSI